MNHKNFRAIYIHRDENFMTISIACPEVRDGQIRKKLSHENKVKFLLTSLPYDKRRLDQPIYLKICFLQKHYF